MEELDPMQEAEKTVDESWRRLESLELKDKNLNTMLDLVNLKWHSSLEDYSKESLVLREDIQDFQRDFKKNVNFFLNMINTFKNAATSEAFEKLKKKVDEQEYEELVTREEFKKMLLEKLKDYV